ncbi:MAG: hypothetical protein KJZ69_17065 [Phycisphaerales bacterium]|nr:hypothetical protein [Phycisphaerales bacterium]
MRIGARPHHKFISRPIEPDAMHVAAAAVDVVDPALEQRRINLEVSDDPHVAAERVARRRPEPAAQAGDRDGMHKEERFEGSDESISSAAQRQPDERPLEGQRHRDADGDADPDDDLHLVQRFLKEPLDKRRRLLAEAEHKSGGPGRGQIRHDHQTHRSECVDPEDRCDQAPLDHRDDEVPEQDRPEEAPHHLRQRVGEHQSVHRAMLPSLVW